MRVDRFVEGLTGWRQMLLALVAGAALGLVQAPWSFPAVFFVAIPVLFWLHTGAFSKRRAAFLGWLAGLGYFLLVMAWIVEPFQIDAEKHAWIAPFALLGMAAGLAVFWSVAFGIARRGSILDFVIFWTLLELVRAYIFTGFPWGLIGYGWLDTPVIQATSVIGVHGVGALTLASILLMAAFLKRDWRRAIGGIAIVVLLWGFGSYRMMLEIPERDEEFTVRIVQPNAAQELKWLPEFRQVFYDRLLELSSRLSDKHPDIVVWPESSVTFLPSRRPDLLQHMASAIDGAILVYGTRLLDPAENWYNGLIVLDQLGTVLDDYGKHHLVPFGEYVPQGELLTSIGLESMVGTGFTKGYGEKIIDVAGVPAFLPMICYETIFPQHAMIFGERPEWLLQLTNDAWFGDFSGPYQHLAQARVRAIEQGLPLVRSANTGVSAMINARGEVVDSLPLRVAGFVDVVLPGKLPKTIYAQAGDWLIATILILLAFSQLIPRIGALRGKVKDH